MIAQTNGNHLAIRQQRSLTQGSVGETLDVSFSEDWTGLAVTAVFSAGMLMKDVLVKGETIPIPWELFNEADHQLLLSFHGARSDGSMVMRTNISSLGQILPSRAPVGENSEPPSPSLVDQIRAAAEEALAVARSVRSDADTGAFNGLDGSSPTARITKTGNTATIEISDQNGTTTATVRDCDIERDEFDRQAEDVLDMKNTFLTQSAVGAMLYVAESYFAQAYGENTHLVYESGRGLFSPSITSSAEGEEGYPAIVCSQFSQALMKGILFAQSRYVLPNNHIAGWGFTTDGTGTYADSGFDFDDAASKDYMDAAHQCKYALDHGWLYTISDIKRQVRPGDFVFYGLDSVSSWEDVTHVALVLHVGLDDGYMINIESDDKTLNGKRVGVIVKRFPMEKSGGQYLYGAHFPVHDSLYKAVKVLEDTDLSGTNPSYMIRQYDTPSIMPAGFYTAIIDGDFAASRVEIGIRYADAAANTFDYSNGRMVKNAGRYAVTFYAAKPFVQVRIGATANNLYRINRWGLFKGYFGQDWPF